MVSRFDYPKILLKAQKYLSDGVLIFDSKAKGIPLVFINKSVTKIFGLSNKELIGKSYKFLESEYSDKKNIDKMRDSFNNKHNCTTDLILLKKDGSKIYCRISISPIPDSEGKTDCIVCILRDITDQREKLTNKIRLSIVESTLRTVNDIFFNYMNAIQFFRLDCEQHITSNKIKFEEWDKAHNDTLEKLKRINQLKEYKEKKIGENLFVIKN